MPRKKKTAAKKKGHSWLFRLFALMLPVGLAFAVYLLYLDYQIKSHFEGDRWAIPARVYARPLTLYPGAPVTKKHLTAELKQLGYQPVESPKRPGTWARNKQVFVVYSRPFQYFDGHREAEKLIIQFQKDRIHQMQNSDGQEVTLTRLDPVEIGSIYPRTKKEDRVIVSHDELPKLLVQSLIATEDRAFYDHHGVNPKGILRALIANIRAGRTVQGGSTLTQQLVKNFYLTREKTLIRKINEALMAILLDARYEKRQILEAYANEIYLGQDGARGIHGFGLASYFYFNRPVSELNLSQIATLVGMVKGPSYYNPRRHVKRVQKRRDLVLKLMLDQHMILPADYKQAVERPLQVSQQKGSGKNRRFAYLDLVKRQLLQDYREEDLSSEGLRIFTTMEAWTQLQAEKAATERLNKLEKWYRLPKGELETAAVVADSSTGEVLALIGGREAGVSGFNRALDASRPIGSLVKPAVFLTALSRPNQYSLITPLKDEPISLKGEDGKTWTPRNFEGKSFGLIPLHEALSKSHNLSTVHLGLDVGLKNVISTIHALGVRKKIKPYPSILLGSTGMSVLEVTQMYQGFASGGFISPLRAIAGVQDKQGQMLQAYPVTLRSSVDKSAVYLTNLNMQEVVRTGTGKNLSKLIPSNVHVAGKTGTTNDSRDSWFAGFTGNRVASVWVGHDDNKSTRLTGATGAMLLWGDMMRRLVLEPVSLPEPENVNMYWVDEKRQQLAEQACKQAIYMPFIQGSQPTSWADCAKNRTLPKTGIKSPRKNTTQSSVTDFFDELFE